MSEMNRRDAMKLLGLMAAASTFSFSCTPEPGDEPAAAGLPGETQPGPGYQRRFFTDHELATVTLLADMIIPADDRSGSASDAGVPLFMDFSMSDEVAWNLERRQTAMRGGLAWLDYQCLQRFGNLFVDCTPEQRTQLLDLIAYPDDASDDMARGVAFFNSFRDLTASGFYSSKMGVDDVQYVGNTSLTEFPGCPQEVLDHVGVAST